MPRQEGTPPHGETPGIYIPEVKVAFKAWSHILSWWDYHSMLPKFEVMWMIMIKQGGHGWSSSRRPRRNDRQHDWLR